ncbi:MAG: peptidylprolyl isomerase [Roseinatronobacter sp.]
MRDSRLFSIRSMALVAGLVAALGAGLPAPVHADGLFAPARRVNDRIITNYDVEQRMRFLDVLNAGSADLRTDAIARLTEEAVQRDLAARRGVRASRDEVAEGMREFAARANLETEELVTILAEAGVDRQTFMNFVEAGLLWRQLAGAQLPLLVAASTADAERARDTAAILGRPRVLLSEIFLPADPQFAEPVAEISALILAARSVDEFSEIAREFSLAGSREQGGRLPDWVPLENLPGPLAASLAEARSGQVIGPLELGEALAFFQVRALESRRDIPPDRIRLSYKRLLLPGGRSDENLARLAQMRARVTNCASLGPFARGLPEEALVAREGLLAEIPQSHAVELARLDRNQISANTIEGNNLVVFMLCSRELQFDDAPSVDQVRNLVLDRRISDLANVRLQELIADADIVDF